MATERSRFFNAAFIAADTQARRHGTAYTCELLRSDFNELCEAARMEFAKIAMSCPSDYVKHVWLTRNATQAARRVLFCLRQFLKNDNCSLLTTTEEYNSVLASIDEVWPGPVYALDWSEALLREDVQDKPDEAVKLLLQSIRVSRPSVIVLSHVTRATGFQLTIHDLKKIREEAGEAFILLDAAESAGNVDDKDLREAFQCVDAAITSGHKWLGGDTSTGLLYCKDPDELTVFKDPSESESQTKGAGGTGDLDAIASLVWAMRYDRAPMGSDRTPSAIGKEFRDALKKELEDSDIDSDCCKVIGYKNRETGIVAVKLQLDGESNSKDCLNLLNLMGYEFTSFQATPARHDESGGIKPVKERYQLKIAEQNFTVERVEKVAFKNWETQSYCFGGALANSGRSCCAVWRFSVAYYHSYSDIVDLANAIIEVVKRKGKSENAESSTSDRGPKTG
jgi:selenocysteine lyase/cysteine desulfurase